MSRFGFLFILPCLLAHTHTQSNNQPKVSQLNGLQSTINSTHLYKQLKIKTRQNKVTTKSQASLPFEFRTIVVIDFETTGPFKLSSWPLNTYSPPAPSPLPTHRVKLRPEIIYEEVFSTRARLIIISDSIQVLHQRWRPVLEYNEVSASERFIHVPVSGQTSCHKNNVVLYVPVICSW